MIAESPTPEAVRAARAAAGLTLAQASDLVFVHIQTWAKWESAQREMHAAFFELFLLKTGQQRLIVDRAAARSKRAS